MGQTASQFPYNLGDEVRPPARGSPSTWKLYRATAKAGGARVCVHSFDKKAYGAAELDAARNALQRLKTLRHPNILRFVDGAELEERLFVVTEEVEPLDLDAPEYRGADAEAFLALGLRQLVVAVSFLNNDCKMVHANVRPSSVFVTPAGEWKLGGFDVVYPHGQPVASVTRSNVAVIVPKHYRAPFRSWQEAERAPAWAADAWSLACVFYEAFNHDFRSENQLGQAGRVPRSLRGAYARLLQVDSEARMNPRDVLDCPFFKNDLVESVDFLSNLPIKSDDEKRQFFAGFAGRVGGYAAKPSLRRVLHHGVLPHLAKALEFGSAAAAFPDALASAFAVAAGAPTDVFETVLQPAVLKLYARNERAVRMQLLSHLDKYAHHLGRAAVNDKIWPCVRTGFADQFAALRELSLKSVVHFLPLLDTATVDNEVMRVLARLQTDPEPSIRTNTTYCLGKVAPNLSAETRRRVLASAFSRCLRDTFVPARVAGLSAFFACSAYFDAAQAVQRVFPAILPCALDPEPEVREAALKAVAVYVQVLRDHSDNAGAAEKPLGAEGAEAPGQANGSAVNRAAGMLGSMGSWAVNSLTKKLSGSEGGGGAAQQQQQQQQRQPAAAASVAASRPAPSTQQQRRVQPQQQQQQQQQQRSQQPKASSSWDDDFFGAEEDDGAPAAVAALSIGGGGGGGGGVRGKPRKSAAERKAEREAKRAAKRSGGSGGGMSLKKAEPAAKLDDWDDWGSMDAPAPAAHAPVPASGAGNGDVDDFFGSLGVGGDGGGGGSADANPFAPVPEPAAAAAAAASQEDDPFAALGMAESDPKLTQSAASGLSLGGVSRAPAKKKPAATRKTKKPVVAAVPAGGDDDWESFLNG